MDRKGISKKSSRLEQEKGEFIGKRFSNIVKFNGSKKLGLREPTPKVSQKTESKKNCAQLEYSSCKKISTNSIEPCPFPTSTYIMPKRTVKIKKEESQVHKGLALNGIRTADMSHILSEICRMNENHNLLFDCNFNDMHLLSSVSCGFNECMKFKCKVCKKESSMWLHKTDGPSINKKFVISAISSGISYDSMHQFLSGVDMPTICSESYFKKVLEFDKKLEDSARASVKEAESPEQEIVEKKEIDCGKKRARLMLTMDSRTTPKSNDVVDRSSTRMTNKKDNLPYNMSDFVPKITRGRHSSNQSVMSTSSKFSLSTSRFGLNKRASHVQGTQSLIEPPAPVRSRGLANVNPNLNVTNTSVIPSDDSKKSASKSIYENAKPGPSGLSKKKSPVKSSGSPNKSSSAAVEHTFLSPPKRRRSSHVPKLEKRLTHPIHELIEEEIEDESEAAESKPKAEVALKTPTKSLPTKSPRKRRNSATPTKSGPSPAKSYRKSPFKPFDSMGFCKICQLPLVCIKISEYEHARKCEVPDNNSECPDGEDCKSTNRMHYIDYKHSALAILRATDSSSSDIQVINRAEPVAAVTVVVEPDLTFDFRSASSSSKKKNDNPFLCDSDEEDLFAEYDNTAKKLVDSSGEEEQDGEVENFETCQDMEETKILSTAKIEVQTKLKVKSDVQPKRELFADVQPCLGGVCDQNKVSVEICANGETLKFCANANGWEKNECIECPGLKGTFCRCGRNLVVETQSKEEYYKKQMEAKEKWAANPIMNRMRSKDSSAASLSTYSSVVGSKSRACPHYKLIKDTSFAVDAFSYGSIPLVKFYFLSHFHYDHYMGLNKHFTGIIYCSQITANLVKTQFKLSDKQLRILPLDETIVVDGVKVTALDANHCPGSLMLLFQLLDGTNIVHTGDFRFSPAMESYSSFWNIQVDFLHLDTTYCSPKYDFEPQEEILQLIGSLAEEQYQLSDQKCLFVCGAYTIGKEKVFVEIARKLDLKFYASESGKRRILKLLEDPQISELMVEKSDHARIHILPNGKMTIPYLSNYLSTVVNKNGKRFTSIVAFKPTGWQHDAKRIEIYNEQKAGNITIFGVPYSEHSSFSELKRFVKFLKPRKIHATVRSKGCSWNDMNNTCNKWLNE